MEMPRYLRFLDKMKLVDQIKYIFTIKKIACEHKQATS